MSAVMIIDHSQIPPCPPPGSGVNRWLLPAAHHLRHLGVPEFDAAHILRNRMTRPEKGREIDRAIRRAYNSKPFTDKDEAIVRYAMQARATGLLNPRLQMWDHQAIQRIVGSAFTYLDLRAVSPISFGLRAGTRGVIDALFPEDSLICCSRAKDWGTETKLISEFKDELDEFSFIVPQTMTKREGATRDNPPKNGPRTLDNTGPWRFFVYESDFLSLDNQAAVIYKLATIRPLALVVFSGSKSVHAYFYVGALSERELREFQCLAIRLGGCTGPLNRCQLVRMPGGFNHSTKCRQEVVYFDPSVTL